MFISLVPIIDGGGVVVFFDAEAAQALFAQFVEVGGAVRQIQDPFVEPALEAVEGAGAHVVFVVKLVVAVGVALHGRGRRAPGFVYDCAHFERWTQHAVGIAHNYLTRHDFFGDQDYVARGQHGFFADTYIAPDVRVAIFVAALHMDDGYVGTDGGDKQQRGAIEWGWLYTQCGVLARDIAAQQRMSWNER